MKISKLLTVVVSILISNTIFAIASFNEVWNVVQENPTWAIMNSNLTVQKKVAEINLYKLYTESKYPTYEVNASRFIEHTEAGILDLLKIRATKTLTEKNDYYPSFDKLLHSNGICLSGVWKITENSTLTGVFKPGTQLPLIARASTTLSGVNKNEKRGFSLAIKIFPTSSKSKKVETLNAFFIDVLAGTELNSIFDAAPTNQPQLGFSLDLPLGAHVTKTFFAADSNPLFRPIDHLFYEPGVQTHSKKWISLVPQKTNPQNQIMDFRDEFLDTLNEGSIVYDVVLNDQITKLFNIPSWKKFGEIHFTKAAVTYGCDKRLHFPHPKID